MLAAPLFAQEQQTPRAGSPSGFLGWQAGTACRTGSRTCRACGARSLRGVFSLTNPMTGGDDFAQRLGGPPIRRPSRIVDPADGKVPYQPWAAALQERQSTAWENATQPWEIDTQSRCLLSIAPRTVDAADAVSHHSGARRSVAVLSWEDHHTPTASRPASTAGRISPRASKLWMGDARGHWESNTLVIDTTNHERQGTAQRRRRFPQRARARDRAPDRSPAPTR